MLMQLCWLSAWLTGTEWLRSWQPLPAREVDDSSDDSMIDASSKKRVRHVPPYDDSAIRSSPVRPPGGADGEYWVMSDKLHVVASLSSELFSPPSASLAACCRDPRHHWCRRPGAAARHGRGVRAGAAQCGTRGDSTAT